MSIISKNDEWRTTPRTTQPVMRPVSKAAGDLKVWQAEMDGWYATMLEFPNMEPDQVFVSLSAWTARASYMRSFINRSEQRTQQTFRTKQIDPFIAECDRQFKIWSRVFSVQSLDWNLQGRMT